jgi:hypothetical protein
LAGSTSVACRNARTQADWAAAGLRFGPEASPCLFELDFRCGLAGNAALLTELGVPSLGRTLTALDCRYMPTYLPTCLPAYLPTRWHPFYY